MASRQLHLWPEAPTVTEDLLTAIATLELWDGSRHSLWYRFPVAHREALTTQMDPFVMGTLFLAMRRRADLQIHGTASPVLLRNLTEFQAAWSEWRSHWYQPVDLQADREAEAEAAQYPGAIATFSGGVDSCFTAFRHAKGLCGRSQQPLKAGVMVHGLDIALDQEEAFWRAAARSQAMLASLGLDLIPVQTNFRALLAGLGLNWEDIFGAGLASCLALFQGRYTTGLIPSSFPYRALSFPYGSNPVTDPLLSSHAFRVVHDGAVAARLEKMRAIAQWPDALANLRVCWQGALADRNCGRCEKCIRTILNFRILGVGLPPCFEADISDRAIAETLVEAGPLTEMERVLEAAQAAQITESWVSALGQCIRRSRRHAALQRSRTWLKDHLPDPLLQAGRRLRRP
ncbi:hypothetical protein [Geitlerinema sp. PCC 7407]|uniref:hypothetical protein n=1 Tax=Geitlerinema sp. PCC 7407 TaxID=1173025 RepID=UPI00029F91F6|nr:hypothetical protein [Geitlerinema sp. PCC 7407]AFY67749.1 hypothetical protein GEI7407_3281 [Geitlerinema sp. PCC 7407]